MIAPVALLSDMPVIITGPGEYMTRNGKRVTIREISGPGAFAAKGHVWRMYRGKERPRDNDIWHVSGRYQAVGERGKDIVNAWRPTK